MNIQYIVDLTDEEAAQLKQLIAKGKPSARKVRRANTLLMADGHKHTDDEIIAALSTGRSTVFRTRKRFVEGGLPNALNERSRPGGQRKLDGSQEAFLVATACSEPPKGRSKWTLQLLADAVVAGTEATDVSADTVGRRLRDNKLKPWQKKMWCIPKVNATFVARMEDVLDLYAEPYDPKKPVVCIDEALKQLIEETRTPIVRKPGRAGRYDYEYKRAGTANIFLMIERLRGWRHAKVTKRRCNGDYAHLMRDLVDIHYPDADIIRVVQDNLNTHKPESLYVTFSPEEARRILRKLEFHYTPKHASWLNMVEIEIGVMSQQCLDRRIGKFEVLSSEIAAWEAERNAAGATINWMFDVDRAREKLGRAYPDVPSDQVLRERTEARDGPAPSASTPTVRTDVKRQLQTTKARNGARGLCREHLRQFDSCRETDVRRGAKRHTLRSTARRALTVVKAMATGQRELNVSESLR
jgi:transposase